MSISLNSGQSLALLTDLYQLTMAYGYWNCGRAESEAVFHLTFRVNPSGGHFAVTCGLETAVEWLDELHLTGDDAQYLGGLTGVDGHPLFDDEFLAYLEQLTFRCDLDAIPEGTVAFPHEPLIRVRGPLLQCQIIETALLNIINFQTLIATKASRICRVAGDDEVLEFGLRRAQGIDGGLSASRAAYVGGCHATSNVLAGKLFDIPVRGTHAHSWVMCFEDELQAFEEYAKAMPNNCVFLVDTFDTLDGVRNAIRVGEDLRKRGFEMIGIRLDSGNLAELSMQARVELDAGGFPDAKIVASNDLDEFKIQKLKDQDACISVWGVGTRLATGHDQPALGGVYKLAAVRDHDQWQHKIKLSNDPIKISNPGIQQVRRYSNETGFVGDVIYDEHLGIETDRQGQDSANSFEDLLKPVFRNGKRVYESPSIHESRRRTIEQLAKLPSSITSVGYRTSDKKRDEYPVNLEPRLLELKKRLIRQASGGVR